MMDDGGGGGGGYKPPDTTIQYSDPLSGLRPEKQTPRDFDEREEDENTSPNVGSRSSLRIPRYGSGAGSNTG